MDQFRFKSMTLDRSSLPPVRTRIKKSQRHRLSPMRLSFAPFKNFLLDL